MVIVQLTPEELLMGRVAALIEAPFDPSEDYVERYRRVTDMSLDQDTIKNLNHLTPEQHKKVCNIIRWQRIGCIVVKISERLNVSLKEALDMFYKSNICRRYHDVKKTFWQRTLIFVSEDDYPDGLLSSVFYSETIETFLKLKHRHETYWHFTKE